MKKKEWLKWLLIILMVCIVVSIVMPVLAKAKFGNWDKWDEELPPWDNKGWKEKTYSAFVSFPPLEGTLLHFCVDGKWMVIKVGRSSSAGVEDVFFLLTRSSFIKNKKRQASIIFFSPASIAKDVDGIKDAFATGEIAMVAFPPTKGKVVVKAYEKKNESFLFLEKWTISFKNKTVVFPEKATEFTQKYGNWMNDQFQQQGIEEGKYRLLPRLIVLNDKKKEFFIGMALEVFDEAKTKTLIF